MTDENALMLPPAAGTLALADLTDAEFGARLAQMKVTQARVRQIKEQAMTEKIHYGVIPGTGDKPTIYKAGAEVLCGIFHLVADPQGTTTYGDGETAPNVSITMRCEMHLGDIHGPIVGIGVGACNSWEKKYRYRGGGTARACPGCGTVGTIKRSQFAEEWYCYDKAGGCGAKFPLNDPRILDQKAAPLENADPYDLENTLLKMARKRAYIDGALTATHSSDLFTQPELEDGEPLLAKSGKEPPKARQGPKRAATLPQEPRTPTPPTPSTPPGAEAATPVLRGVDRQQAEGLTWWELTLDPGTNGKKYVTDNEGLADKARGFLDQRVIVACHPSPRSAGYVVVDDLAGVP